MNSSIKKFHVALVLAVVLAFPLLQVPSAYSAEWSAPEKVLSFLTDVVRLDMTKYNATLVSNGVEYPSDLGGLPEDIGKYTLESSESKIDVTYKFRNKTLVYCKINVLKGSPLYAQPSTNILEAAKGLLDRYQTYEGTSHYQVMRNMLNRVNEIENMTITSGNVKLEISIDGDRTLINWIYTSNGIDFDRKKISFDFKQRYLTWFIGGWNLYEIGSTDINVSKEEAIRIARDLAQNVSWTVHMGNNTWIEVTDFKIIDEPLKAELLIGTSREPLKLYPYWRIQLYFDKLYPGWINGIAVAMWADTGEIIYCQTTGFSGGPPLDSSPEVSEGPSEGETSTAPPSEPSPTPQPTHPPVQQHGFLGTSLPMEYGYAIVAVTGVAMAVATGYLYLKRKK